MDDTPQPVTTPLTDQTLQRLRRLAAGNGLDGQAITIIEAQEKIYTLKGVISLQPDFKTQGSRYPGPVRGADRKIFSTLAEMQQEAQTRKEAFNETKDWIGESQQELHNHPGLGWGLDNATITFADKTVVLAASETCTACQGQKLVTCQQCNGQGGTVCPQCGGQRQEMCYQCAGRGEMAGQPGQPCTVCQGRRFVPCRRCQGTGQLVCPTCQGRRGTPCATCQGTGQVSDELLVSCEVKTHFRLLGEGLPSGLRRGLDRLGLANLSKGYADIALAPPPSDDTAAAAGIKQMHPEADLWSAMPKATVDDDKPKAEFPEIFYEARLPYADLKLRFGDSRAVMVSVFGKRAALLGVPAFLDTALVPARKHLAQAAAGQNGLDEALKFRAMRDALSLSLSGKTAVDMRKLYPVGLSIEAIDEMMRLMRLALNRLTLRTRTVTAAVAVILCAALFAALFMTDINANLTQGMGVGAEAALDFGLVIVAAGFSSAALSLMAQGATLRKVPQMKDATAAKPQMLAVLVRGNGKTGLCMLGGIVAAFIVVCVLAPVRPNWLLVLLGGRP